MAFFLGIGGPWIAPMILDLLWTKQSLEHAAPNSSGGWQRHLERLLQKRAGREIPIRSREPVPQRGLDEERHPRSESYLFRTPD
ncbi:hypothetical protein [Methylobacterium oxalidis]|uniref:Uncharacterized protein n=1 Tax=Methylobacterium oxalidis TaxID=944322 RepID=A0A512J5Q8_9HYPH|nr:hypothetical protein [Methylobacterium oxalidis]GEP05306.1 hypothetical protein MOX02_33440 [Methylobacterium oxalidis]GJE30008.1 hypothetical protein LDDCCGHA_0171 [Methylobacterium oxalidis]GLS64650.1 hypothetical protein GCM10007888_30310 [Methylobacterium oxalidis]